MGEEREEAVLIRSDGARRVSGSAEALLEGGVGASAAPGEGGVEAMGPSVALEMASSVVAWISSGRRQVLGFPLEVDEVAVDDNVEGLLAKAPFACLSHVAHIHSMLLSPK